MMAISTLDTARAPFALRCGALLVDYTLLLLPVALTSVFARFIGDGGAIGRTAGEAANLLGYTLAASLFVINFLLLPAISGRTPGKWVAGLRIERTDGGELSLMRAALRHVLGYGATLLTFGAGYLLAAVRADERALHDLIAATVVVRAQGGRRRRSRTR